MFFDGWNSLMRTFFTGVLAYAYLVILLRITGKRTLAKMNAFDLVVTVALGSILASVLLLKDVTLTDGMVALSVLVVLQYILAWLAARFRVVRNLIKAEPTLVVYQGQFLHDAIKAQRLTLADVRMAIRNQGIANIDNVAAVVLETEGSFTIIPTSASGQLTVLEDVADQIPK